MNSVNYEYIKCPSEFKNKLAQLLGPNFSADDPTVLAGYSQDKTENLNYPPDALAKPETAAQICQILKWANKYLVPVTVRARGTGLAGAALAIHGGLCLSMEKFDRILEIDRKNLQAVVEPYIKNFSLQQAARREGLFYPPDPASYRICSLGGNFSHNSGGPKALKYGTTRQYVLQLAAVLPSGEQVTLGSRTIKNSTGYSLKDLVIGSEGTLAIITRAVLRLLPFPSHNVLLQVSFSSLTSCATAVHKILLSGIIPSGLELMGRTAIEHAKLYCKTNFPKLEETTAAHLLIELDGNSINELTEQQQCLQQLLADSAGVEQINIAATEQVKENLWRLRRNVYTAIKAQGISKELDFCVPIANFPEVFNYLDEVGNKYGFASAAYGHAGDGNLHVGIISQGCDEQQLFAGIKEIFRYVCQNLEGAISAEHGIGLVQQPFIDLHCSPLEIELMRKIKRAFDPNNILNPGKIFNDNQLPAIAASKQGP